MRAPAPGAPEEAEAAEAMPLARAPQGRGRRRPRPSFMDERSEPPAPSPFAPPRPAGVPPLPLAPSPSSTGSSGDDGWDSDSSSIHGAVSPSFSFPLFGPLIPAAAASQPAYCQPHPHHHPHDPHTASTRAEDDAAAATAAATAAASAAAAAASAAAVAAATAATASGAVPGSEMHVDHEGGFCKPCSQAWRALRAVWRGEPAPGVPIPPPLLPPSEAGKAEAAAGAAAAAAALPEHFVASAPVAASAAGAVMGTAAGSAAAAAVAKAGSWTHHAVAASTALLKFNCGLIGGVTQAGLFNPWDRALYLSVKHSRPFLSVENFSRPYQGFGQAIAQRTLSTGLYFPLEDLFMQPCYEIFEGNKFLAAWMAGNLAGALNGIALNPASAIKYQTWGQDDASFWRTARLMWRDGGIRPFLKGTSPTILRDLTFGGVYSLLRNGLLRALREVQGDNAPPPPPSMAGGRRGGGGGEHVAAPVGMESFVLNVVAAGIATTVSGPFNYVRNIKYSFPADMAPPSTGVILRDLWDEVLSKPHLGDRLSLLQERLRVGWGTARVAVGMAFTAHVYEYCKYGSQGKAGRELRRRLTGRPPDPQDDYDEEEEEGPEAVPVMPEPGPRGRRG